MSSESKPNAVAASAPFRHAEDGLDLLGNRWVLWLLMRLQDRRGARFAELADQPGLSRRVLSERLQQLIATGLVLRRPYQRRPTRHDYWLSARGAVLKRLLAPAVHVAGGGQLGPAEAGTSDPEAAAVAEPPADPAARAELVAETVGPLIAYDEQYRTQLLDTLEAYIESDASTSLTASRMYLHRHTVRYRLGRIRELTGLDVDRLRDRERLVAGLRAHRAGSSPAGQA